MSDPKISGVPIEAIWPDAFKTGRAVKLRGKTKKNAFTRAWFECIDGRIYPLTQHELKEYKPDVRISKSFKTT